MASVIAVATEALHVQRHIAGAGCLLALVLSHLIRVQMMCHQAVMYWADNCSASISEVATEALTGGPSPGDHAEARLNSLIWISSVLAGMLMAAMRRMVLRWWMQQQITCAVLAASVEWSMAKHEALRRAAEVHQAVRLAKKLLRWSTRVWRGLFLAEVHL